MPLGNSSSWNARASQQAMHRGQRPCFHSCRSWECTVHEMLTCLGGAHVSQCCIVTIIGVVTVAGVRATQSLPRCSWA